MKKRLNQQITTNRDLRALCLNSKRAIPRLYKHINILLWHRSAFVFYQQSYLRGRDYLRHTRNLVIEHQEITYPHNSSAREDPYKSNEAAVKLGEDLNLVTLMAVLQLFPPDVLRDFRYSDLED